MVEAIYVEDAVADEPRTAAICRRFPRAARIPCRRYGEVFNRRAQSFRLQKRSPSLILAQKHERFVLATPEGYGVGGERNFYFSHMLNCLYDCRYCFLQGMYRSAHYVLFVNYDGFFAAIAAEARAAATAGEAAWFFSGYDCDSLAFEPVSGFVASALPVFAGLPQAWLELRTKSTQIAPLLAAEALPNVVVAFSFTPEEVSRALEHRVPSVKRRLQAMARLRDRGWRLGLRFDPLIYLEDFEAVYRRLFDQVFATVDAADLHSVSFGPFRLPRPFFRTLERLYPDAPLVAGPLAERGAMVSYRPELEAELVGFCRAELSRRVPPEIFFPCAVT